MREKGQLEGQIFAWYSSASPDLKNTKLLEGIYTFPAGKYSTTDSSTRRKQQAKQATALNKAKKLKNEAQRILHQAKSRGT